MQAPRSPEHAIERALVLADEGRLDESTALLSAAIVRWPERAPLYVHRARVHQIRHEYVRAIRDCERALELDPRDGDAYFARARAFHARGRLPEALLDFDRAVAMLPNEVMVHCHRALCRSEAGDTAGALEDAGRAVVLEPLFDEVYLVRGRVYERAGDWERALLDFRQLLRIDVRDLEGRWRAAHCLIRLERYAEAERELEAALRLEASEPEALDLLGELHQLHYHDFEAALEFHRRALQAFPYFTRALVHYGQALMELGRAAEAERAFEVAFYTRPEFEGERVPEAARIFFYRGLARAVEAAPARGTRELDLPRAAGALSDFSEALRLRPDFGAAHYHLGRLLRRLSRAPEAVRSFEQAIRHGEQHVAIYFDRGLAHLEAGAPQAAVCDFARVLTLDAEHDRAVLERARAYAAVARERAAVSEFAALYWRRAFADLDAQIAVYPRDPEGLRERERLLAEWRLWNAGLPELQRATEPNSAPVPPAASGDIAVICDELRAAGRALDALELARDFLMTHSENTELTLRLYVAEAEAAAALHDHHTALAAAERALVCAAEVAQPGAAESDPALRAAVHAAESRLRASRSALGAG